MTIYIFCYLRKDDLYWEMSIMFMVGHIFDRSVGNLKPTIIFIWPNVYINFHLTIFIYNTHKILFIRVRCHKNLDILIHNLYKVQYLGICTYMNMCMHVRARQLASVYLSWLERCIGIAGPQVQFLQKT